jgi:hypothetical protein
LKKIWILAAATALAIMAAKEDLQRFENISISRWAYISTPHVKNQGGILGRSLLRI